MVFSIGYFGKAMIYLEIPASEHTLVEDQSLRDKIGLRKFYIGIAVIRLELFLVWGVACSWCFEKWI